MAIEGQGEPENEAHEGRRCRARRKDRQSPATQEHAAAVGHGPVEAELSSPGWLDGFNRRVPERPDKGTVGHGVVSVAGEYAGCVAAWKARCRSQRRHRRRASRPLGVGSLVPAYLET